MKTFQGHLELQHDVPVAKIYGDCKLSLFRATLIWNVAQALQRMTLAIAQSLNRVYSGGSLLQGVKFCQFLFYPYNLDENKTRLVIFTRSCL